MYPTTGGSLAVADYYTPNSYSYLLNGSGQTSVCFVNSTSTCPPSQTNGIPTSKALATNDYDLGSGGLTLITPNPTSYNVLCGSNAELIAAGKEGVVYGVCYSPGATSQMSAMGGLDACGYSPSSGCLSLINSAAQNGLHAAVAKHYRRNRGVLRRPD